MKTLLVSDNDLAKALKLLGENGIDAQVETPIPFLRTGNASPTETPASFGGIWAKDERTMESIRKAAWPKRR
ncbi:hypothetical protein [Fibrivirga algicola]|jgi:hypothetical protein|uniref:DUF2007 domain-containing protein n=1 Tax=Fibrivirga algicola TaxID=2950420 RepID=A0ABX0QGI8_9BACT|nr:hypothetical protein [Fibrivirga algicola]NID11344.1 hypothetical protein [Fibrivirga algicola]